MPDMADDFFRMADLSSHRKPISRDPEQNEQTSRL